MNKVNKSNIILNLSDKDGVNFINNTSDVPFSNSLNFKLNDISSIKTNLAINDFNDKAESKDYAKRWDDRDIDSSTDTFANAYNPYKFYGTISEEVLHRYLEKSIQMSKLSHLKSGVLNIFNLENRGEGPNYPDGYDPENPSTVHLLHHPDYEHGKLLRMIINIGAKFVWDSVFFRPHQDWDYLKWITKTLKYDIDFLHQRDPDIIYGAGFSEVLDPRSTNIKLPPPHIMNMFYPGGLGKTRKPTADPIYFDYKLMMLDHSKTLGWDRDAHINLASPESRMYYYYLSTKFIDSGCESIHFGDLFNGSTYDPGNKYMWDLMSKIRQYASVHAHRKVILLDTHAGPNKLFEKSHYLQYLHGWYHDPDPYNPLPNWRRQLIFDFHALGLYSEKNVRRKEDCYDVSDLHTYGSSVLPIKITHGRGLLNKGKGGLHPQGWLCSHSPSIIRFDNGSIEEKAGCSYPLDDDIDQVYGYGYDNTSWYARQTLTQKSAILRYLFFKIKCIDPYHHLCMPGLLITRVKKRNKCRFSAKHINRRKYF